MSHILNIARYIAILIGFSLLVVPILTLLRKFWNKPNIQRKFTPENPWSSLIWLTLVIRDGLPEFREKSRHLVIDIDESILLSSALSALLMILESIEFIDKCQPLLIENKNNLAIFMIFRGERVYIFVTHPKNKFVFKPYSKIFIRSYERYSSLFGGIAEDD